MHSLALSSLPIRGLGDRDFKDEGLLICEPEVTNVVLQPHVDQFSVMASDGLWGFVTDQEVVDTVNGVLEEVSTIECVAAFGSDVAIRDHPFF